MKNSVLFMFMLSASALNAMDEKEKITERSKIRREEMRAKLNEARKQALANQKNINLTIYLIRPIKPRKQGKKIS